MKTLCKKSLLVSALLITSAVLFAAPVKNAPVKPNNAKANLTKSVSGNTAKAPANPRTLEGYPYKGNDLHVLEFCPCDTDDISYFPISDDVVVYNREGEKVTGDARFTAARSGPSFILLDGDTVIEVYQQKSDYVWGSYDGPGIRYNPESKPSTRIVEGLIQVSFYKTVDIVPFGTDKVESYPDLSKFPKTDTVYKDENGHPNKSRLSVQTGSGKVRVTLIKVNGKEFASEVLMLPEQYGKSGNKDSAATAKSSDSKKSSSYDDDDGWTDGSNDSADNEGWDGWSDSKQYSRDWEVKEAYGYIKNSIAGDSSIQIARADGKYKTFMVMRGIAFDPYNEVKCYDINGNAVKFMKVKAGWYVRYLIANRDGEDKIVEIRALPEGKKYQEKEVDIPEDAITRSVSLGFKKPKKGGFEGLIDLTVSNAFFKVTEDTVCYDLYDREIPWQELEQFSEYHLSVTYVERNGEKIALKVCYN